MYRFYINCHHWRPTRDQWLYAIRCLPIHEIHRIDEYKYQRDVKFTLVGQLLIRYLLTHVFEKKSSSFIIQRTKSNRPFLIDINSTFDFNLSHHNQLVCIAGTFNGQIGCDTIIYRNEKIPDYEKLIEKKFTLDEKNFLRQNEKFRLSSFYRLWCLKESYLKWLGMGIGGMDLLRLNFKIQTLEFNSNEIVSNTLLEIEKKLIEKNIRFDEQIINLEHNEQQIICLCLAIQNSCQLFVELNMDDILNGCTPFDENKQENFISWERFQMKKTNR